MKVEQTKAIPERQLRKAYADVIQRRRDDIVQRWLEQVKIDAAADQVAQTDLIEGIHKYLSQLSELLRGDESIDSVGTSAWQDIARKHIENRVRLDFDVSQVFHELILLRQTTADVLREEGKLSGGREAEPLFAIIDAAISAAIKSYVEARDEMARRKEAEHLGFLTHELRNRLGVAVMAVDQLKRPDVPAAARERAVDLLSRSIDRMRRLIDIALTMGRLQAGKVEVRPVQTTIGKLTEDSIPLFRSQAEEKGVRFTTNYDPDVPVRTDPNLTMSALQNLLDNAVKYTDSGEVQLTCGVEQGQFVVHVRDTGKGLTPEQLPVIFEPYRRLESGKPGSGLGLAIARSVIEAQGGTMHAESEPGRGSHFWFMLPQNQDPST